MKTRPTGTMLLALSLLVLGVLACKSLSFGSSPTATFKAFYEAQKNKDVPAIKKTLSKNSLDMLEKAAKEQNKSVDDSLKEGFDNPTFKAANIPETRNEKIEGANATLEVLDADTKKWEKLYFVKEDNDWKLALDKIIEEAFKNLGK
ncbi:MAG TPA: hypothetical protein VLH87_07065 [Pyrinomonadaceae bacterium]|nr:hypothetical protein [Pyrinomonadaceae bacterium]